MENNVLILVLMEDTLREKYPYCDNKMSFLVLILVLMEDTLRDETSKYQ